MKGKDIDENVIAKKLITNSLRVITKDQLLIFT